jgi:hypothetical protein
LSWATAGKAAASESAAMEAMRIFFIFLSFHGVAKEDHSFPNDPGATHCGAQP